MEAGPLAAASLLTALSLGLLGIPLLSRSPANERAFLTLLVAIMLPMNALAFHAVRLPLDSWLADLLTGWPESYRLLRAFYAPLTEEPAKLWPLLIPWFYRRIALSSIVRTAWAIGLGFGIGEAWTVAAFLSHSPEIARLPWYLLGGYVGERLMVCLMHAAFTAVALHGIIVHRSLARGLAGAMLLHLIGNLPLFLASYDLFGRGQMRDMLLQFWVIGYFLLMGAILAFLAYGKTWMQRLFRGRVTCPSCQTLYTHPIFGLNLFHKRFERCPHCKKWHLVSAFDETPEGA